MAGLAAKLPSRFARRISFIAPTADGPEEVDLVLIDDCAQAILFGELRWMLQPGDVREVLNRKKVIKEKVVQASRKVAGARAALPDVLKRLGLRPGDWTINGVVIIEGYGGAASDDPKMLPVVPHDVFLRAIARCPDLNHAHAVLGSPLWLPREGIDFVARWDSGTICGIQFNRPGLEVGLRSYLRESLDSYLTEAFEHTVDQLRMLPW